MKRVSFLVLLGLAACSTTAVHDPITRIESAILPSLIVRGEPVETRSLLERMAEDGVPGVSIAVVLHGELAWARGYGYADREAQTPVTPETMFQAASISKPVAALAALKLVEEGRLELDADVNGALTSWKLPENEFTEEHKVTLRGLVTHTGGTTVWGFPGYARDLTTPSTIDVLNGRGNTDAVRVWKTPGQSWRYSGGGYTVLQLLLSDVSGKPFPDVMRELVLEPLRMTHSTYEQPLPERWHLQAAVAYRDDGNRVKGDWHVYPEMAAAGLWTTPSDLARFILEIQKSYRGEGAILSRAMAMQMLRPGMNEWGLGPAIEGDGTRFGHGGSNEGFRCALTAFIEEGSGAVVMTNSDNGGRLADEILLTIAKEYGWEGMEPETKEVVELDRAQYEMLTGSYRIEETGRIYRVSYIDGKLWFESGGTPVELLPESATTFFFAGAGGSVEFLIEDDDDDAIGILVGGSVRGYREP